MAARKTKKVIIAELRADVSGVHGDVKKAVSHFQKGEKDIAKTMKGINSAFHGALGIGATVITGKLTKGFIEMVGSMAEAGDRVNDIAGNFKKLGGTVGSIEAAQKALLGTMTAVDLMAQANKGLLKTLPGFDAQFSKLADLAGRVAEATGTDAAQSINKLMAAVSTGKTGALNKFGFELTGIKDKTLLWKKIVEQLPGALAKFNPMAESAGQAFGSLKTALQDGYNSMASTIDNSDQLQQSFKDLEKTTRQVDWNQLGTNLAGVAATMVNLANLVLPPLVEQLNKAAMGFEYLMNSTDRSKAVHLKEDIGKLKEQVLSRLFETQKEAAQRELSAFGGGDSMALALGLPSGTDSTDALQAQLIAKEREYKAIMDRMKEGFQGLQAPASGVGKALSSGIDAAGEKAEKLKEKLQDAFDQKLLALDKQQLDRELNAAIKAGDTGAFNQLMEKFRELTKAGILQGLHDSIGKPGGPSDEEAQSFANRSADFEAESRIDQMADANKSIADDLEQKMTAAFQEAAGFWKGVWSEVIETGTFDFKKALNDMASSFLGDITAGIFGGPAGGGFGGIGSMFAQMIMASMFGGGGGMGMMGMMGGAGGGAGGGMMGMGMGMAASAAGGYLASTGVGAGFAAGMAGTGVGSAATAAGGAGVMTSTGATVGAGSYAAGSYVAAAMPYLAVAAAIYMIGNKQGWWGNHKPQNDETKARVRVEQMIEDRFKERGAPRDFYRGSIHNFDPGRSGWDNINSMDDSNKALLTGFGEGLKALEGTTQDIGPQIGAMLADNIGAGVDKAKMYFKELGYSAEEMIQAVIDNGVKMGKSWLEINRTLEQIDRLAAPGLEGVGDVAGSITELQDSAAEGMDALIAIQDLVVESGEAKLKTLEDLKKKLLETMSPEQVEMFMQALKDAGINSMEDLANASQRQLIKIIARLQELGFAFKEADSDAQGLKDTIDSTGEDNPGDPDRGGYNSYPADKEEKDTEVKAAVGGTFFGPTHALIGEGGPEVVLPLTRRGGILGIRGYSGGGGGGGVTVNIDARGAELGVEKKIRAELINMEERLVGRTLNIIATESRRGGALGDSFGG